MPVLPKAPPRGERHQKQYSPITFPLKSRGSSPAILKRNPRSVSLTRLPSDTEEGADHLIASCEQYLDENLWSDAKENPNLINPFVDVNLSPAQPLSPLAAAALPDLRKLSSVSDIRESIKLTHEDANLNQTLPRAFPRSKRRQRDQQPRQDGTESVRSFVIVSASRDLSSLSGDEEWSDEGSDSEVPKLNRGSTSFVNKFATRVKSLVNK